MRWTYDAEVEALYIYLREGTVSRQVEVHERFILDVTADGEVAGLEVLNAQEPWSPVEFIGEAHLAPEDLRSLAFVSEGWHQPAMWLSVTRPAALPALHQEDLAASYA